MSGVDSVAAVRRQIAAGADWIKLYADYRWRPEALFVSARWID